MEALDWVRKNCKFAAYSNDLVYLRDYLKNGVDPNDFSYQLENYFNQNGGIPENFNEQEPYEYLEVMSAPQLNAFKTWLENKGNLAEGDALAPSYVYLDYKSIVPPGTWLVHFSDQAEDIGRKGFQFGHEDMQTLGLTTYFKDTVRKKTPGWNFAFEALSRYARNAARTGRYGNAAVLFRCAGVKAYHSGDQEDQIMFLGQSASDIVPISHGENWSIHSSSNQWAVSSNRDGRVLYQSDYDDVVQWVLSNFDQYKNVLVKS